jgi:capsular exopolysaccharide synthesis family protein
VSRVLDALRKAEMIAGKRVPSSPDSFFAGLQSTSELLPLATERVEIRPESRIVAHSAPQSPGGERFLMLRSYLKELQGRGSLKTLLITSGSPRDGKSTVAVNLATALSEKGKYKVLLLEADLRCSSITSLLTLKDWPGLSECLQSKNDPMSSVRLIEPLSIYLLPAGARSPKPLELLQSDVYPQVVTSLAILFDWIVIDAPPAAPIPDVQTLRKSADGAFLVVRAGQTSGEAMTGAARQLADLPILGIILNCAEKLESRYSDYYRRGT